MPCIWWLLCQYLINSTKKANEIHKHWDSNYSRELNKKSSCWTRFQISDIDTQIERKKCRIIKKFSCNHILLWLYIYCKTEMPYTDIISFSKCQMYTVLMFLIPWFVDSYAFLKTDISVWDAIKPRYVLIQVSAINGKFWAMYIIFWESSYQLMPAV